MAFSAPEPGDTSTGTNGTATDGPSEEHRPTPLLAMLGAGDVAVAAVARAFADAYAAAASRRETVQHRVHELPAEFEGLRARFSGDELRRALETYRAQIERAYTQFAGRGEEAWDKLREKPQVRHAMTTLESRVEKVARAGQRFTGRAADAVVDASAAASDAVEDAGTTAAQAIEEAGDEAATATRKATGARGPAKATPRSATPKPAVRGPSPE